MNSAPAVPRLVILGYSEAAMFLRGNGGAHVRAVISIHGAREFGVEAGVPHRLDLAFDDVEVIDDADDVEAMHRARSRRRWAEQNGLVEVPPSEADVGRIISFAEAVRSTDGLVLCHCGAGMSRAAAAALVCLAVWRGPGNEAERVNEIRTIRPGAAPHAGIVRMADRQLGRGGALVAALARSVSS